jgi:TonB family protein
VAAKPVTARAQPAPAATPFARPAPATRVDVIAVTGDDVLLEQVGLALDGETGIRLADSVDAVSEYLDPACAQVILLDAREYPDLGGAVDRLQTLSDCCVVVVLAPDSQASDVATTIKRSAVFAVLPIPIEPGKTAAVLEGAREEALSRAVLAAPQPVPPPIATQLMAPQPAPAVQAAVPVYGPAPVFAPASASASASAPVAIAPPGRPRTPGWLAPAGIALVVLGVAVTWLLVDRAAPDAQPVSAQPVSQDVELAPDAVPVAASAPTTRVEQGSIEELLEKAGAAFRERRYVEPASDSAFLYYQSVLAQAPDNGEAREGMQRVATIVDQRLQSALAERRYDDAAAAFAQLALMRPADPGSEATATRIVEGQIAAALDSGRIDRASQLLQQATLARTLPAARATHWREEIGRRQGGTQVSQLAALVSARISEGKLVEPAGDSARDYLAQLSRLAPNTRTQAATSRKLGQAFLQRAQAAGAHGQTAEAERWLAEARAVGVTPIGDVAAAPVASTPTDTTSTPPATSATERLTLLVQQRISEGRLVDPAQDSAVSYYGALRAADPTAPATAEQARALASQLLEKSGTALAAGDLETAQRHLAAARQIGLDPARIDSLEQRMAAARRPPVAPPALVQSASLERTYYVAPIYPKKALEKQIGGEVRVRITVDADGRVKGIAILSSTPPGVFDQSVLAAVSRWRFKPPPADAGAVDASTVTSVAFKPTDDARR